MPRFLPLVVMLVALFLAGALPHAHASDAESIAIHQHQKAIEELGQTAGDGPLELFATRHIDAKYRASFKTGKLMALLRSIRDASAGAGGVLFAHQDGTSRVRFMNLDGEIVVAFRTQPSVPYQIVMLEIEGTKPVETSVAPIQWETLESRLRAEEKAGFSGSVLVARGGKIVLNRGFGYANRESMIQNDERTIFAIGSTPIDFTYAAILKLDDMEMLDVSDRIAKYFPDIPADKQAITITDLMTGGSGLPDFHHVVGLDADRDLTWIDRTEALKRIFAAKLLFAPGADRKHSHSAWVLLAALVEVASGQSYGDFVRKQLFEPAGMTRTGLHQDLAEIADRDIAVGYEAQAKGKLNSPKYWGKTSWLVMGSGGMNSTPGDLYKFFTAARSAKILSPASAKKFGAVSGVMVGGDDRGFLCMHATRDGDMMILCSNAHSGPGDHASLVGKRLAELVLDSR